MDSAQKLSQKLYENQFNSGIMYQNDKTSWSKFSKSLRKNKERRRNIPLSQRHIHSHQQK